MQVAAIPGWVGDGAGDPLPDEMDGGGAVVLVELLYGATGIPPSSPPRSSAVAFWRVIEMGGGM